MKVDQRFEKETERLKMITPALLVYSIVNIISVGYYKWEIF
jgi:hypothetical protein